ncbi:hypothetical protein CB1_000514004 [Camelus ferus]|nr:hypothetical protein CB1_000514004 [Camelus ferus]
MKTVIFALLAAGLALRPGSFENPETPGPGRCGLNYSLAGSVQLLPDLFSEPLVPRNHSVRTRLLGWDDRAFYLEARFISLRDGFVCALVRSRQHVLGTSPERVVQHLCKRRVEPPELPEDLQHWIAYNEASSQLLRAESGLSDVVKDE